MKKQMYIYKVKKSFVKNHKPERFGFRPYKADGDEEQDTIYAIPVRLDFNKGIAQNTVKNFEQVYAVCTPEEREKDFGGYDFTEVVNTDKGDRKYVALLTPDQQKDFTSAQLCFAVSGFGEYTLFINGPDRVEYYGVNVLNDEVGGIIADLLKNGYIYQRKNNL